MQQHIAKFQSTDTAKPKPKKRNTQAGHPGFLKDPRQARPGESVGAGFFVFRRTGGTGRIRCPEWPFEHPTREAAAAERDRLGAKYKKERFVILTESAPDDGRPCSWQAFLTALLQEVEDNGLLRSAIRAWLHGDFAAALAPLEAETLARLTGQGLIRFRAVSRITGETLAEAAGGHKALEAFTRHWSDDANVSIEILGDTGGKGGAA